VKGMHNDSIFLREALKVAVEAAKRGGEVLQHYWGKLECIKEKEYPGNLVTEADHESEKIILEILSKHYPEYGIIAEESGISKKDESPYIWVVDPLDGTTNYTHQFPMVAISIALLYNLEPIVGVIYNPILQELFQGAAGLGGTLNGIPLAVSKTSSLSHSLLVTGFAYDRSVNNDNNYPEFCRLTQVSQGVRRMGSAALDLAYIAAGKFDGYWESGLQSWDIAAGTLLVREAKGLVTAHDGSSLNLFSGRILATNAIIHESLIRELRAAHPS